MAKKLDGQGSLDKTGNIQAIMDAGRAIHEAFNAIDVIVANRMGVQRNDLRCLLALKYGTATAGNVAVKTGLTSGSVTALLDRLEGAGHIERQRSTSDRRSVEIALTACCQAEMQSVETEIETAIRAYFANRTADEVAASGDALGLFAAALGHCAAAFDEDPASL